VDEYPAFACAALDEVSLITNKSGAFFNGLVFASARCILYSLLGNKQPWTSHGIHTPEFTFFL
jgi:hypothetical protein